MSFALIADFDNAVCSRIKDAANANCRSHYSSSTLLLLHFVYSPFKSAYKDSLFLNQNVRLLRLEIHYHLLMIYYLYC